MKQNDLTANQAVRLMAYTAPKRSDRTDLSMAEWRANLKGDTQAGWHMVRDNLAINTCAHCFVIVRYSHTGVSSGLIEVWQFSRIK